MAALAEQVKATPKVLPASRRPAATEPMETTAPTVPETTEAPVPETTEATVPVTTEATVPESTEAPEEITLSASDPVANAVLGYLLTITQTQGGTITATVSDDGPIYETAYVLPGETVTLTVTPDSGYRIGTVFFNDTPITPVDGVYSFSMPGDAVVTATFVPKINISAASVSLADSSASYQYSGTSHTPAVVLTLDGKTITPDEENFTVTYSDNLYPGDAQIVITAKENNALYTGTATGTFTIGKKEITIQARSGLTFKDFQEQGQKLDWFDVKDLPADHTCAAEYRLKDMQFELDRETVVITDSSGKDVTKCFEVGFITATLNSEHLWKGSYSQGDKRIIAECSICSSCQTLSVNDVEVTYNGRAQEASLDCLDEKGDPCESFGTYSVPELSDESVNYYDSNSTRLGSTPVNAGEYTAKLVVMGSSSTAKITIKKADPTIPAINTFTGYIIGQTLDLNTLLAGYTVTGVQNQPISGTWTYNGSSQLELNRNGYTVTFTPEGADATNYNPRTADILFEQFAPDTAVRPANPVLNATYGQTLDEVELPADENGTWAWVWGSEPVPLEEGEFCCDVTYTPHDTQNYTNVIRTLTVMVVKPAQPITAPSSIIVSYGHPDFNLGVSGALGVLTYAVNPVNVLSVDQDGSVTVLKAGQATIRVVAVNPKSGYQLSTLTVKDANGNSCSVSASNDGKYYFTLPDAAVTVTATFRSTAVADPTNPKTGDEFHTVLWSAMAATSLLCMAAMVLSKKRG